MNTNERIETMTTGQDSHAAPPLAVSAEALARATYETDPAVAARGAVIPWNKLVGAHRHALIEYAVRVAARLGAAPVVPENVVEAARWRYVLENSTRMSEPLVNAKTGAEVDMVLARFTLRLPRVPSFTANPEASIDAARSLLPKG